MQVEIEKFVAELRKSLQNSTFVKLTLGNYKGEEDQLQKISVRCIETKEGLRLTFQSKYSTRDVVKNFNLDAGVEKVTKHLKNGIRSGHLFTTENDFQLNVGKRSARLTKGRPSFMSTPSTSHDREKRHLADSSGYYLKALGITTDSGEVRSNQRDKWKQINKFVEVLAGLIGTSSLKDKERLRIVDMGSGKGYLTFALYDHLSKNGRHVFVTGVEQRKELIELCNEIGETSGFDGLRFVQGRIADFDVISADILIALHACDIATDDALYKAIGAGAEIIVVAPCCHHELKKQIKPPGLLKGILKHPVMLERTAETITDGLRSMLLEASGYKTKMFEFVPTEHTPKNNLLVATRMNPFTRKNSTNFKMSEIAAIRSEFGIEHQRLADLLAAD